MSELLLLIKFEAALLQTGKAVICFLHFRCWWRPDSFNEETDTSFFTPKQRDCYPSPNIFLEMHPHRHHHGIADEMIRAVGILSCIKSGLR
jgi:hypothetical protein